MTTRAHRTLLLVAALTLLVTGCGGGDPGTDPAASATTASPAPTAVATSQDTASQDTASPSVADDGPMSSAGATTPTPTEHASAATPDPATSVVTTGCDPATSDLPPDVPNGAERVADATGDLDGDGEPDRLLTWGVTLGEGEVVFRLKVVTATGHVSEVELVRNAGMADVRPLGTIPIGDGHRAALVVEDAGASAELVSLWGLRDSGDGDCRLGRLTVADDAAAPTFPVGATASTVDDLLCTEVDGHPALTVRSAVATDDGDTYDWTTTSLSWDGVDALRVVATDEGTGTGGEIGLLAGTDCPGVDLTRD
jgi:hypothetical protein